MAQLAHLIHTAYAVNATLGTTACLPQDLEDEEKWPSDVVYAATAIWNARQAALTPTVDDSPD